MQHTILERKFMTQPLVDNQTQAISKLFASDTECKILIEKFNCNLRSIIQNNQQPVESAAHIEFRSVLVKDIDINQIALLKETIISANNNIFKFDLHVDKIDCFFAKYSAAMHYAQLHFDCIAGPLQRKLSFSLLLNDDYDGGDFEVLLPPAMEKITGKLIVFPSYLPHRITCVTKGIRYAIFGWVYGPHYV